MGNLIGFIVAVLFGVKVLEFFLHWILENWLLIGSTSALVLGMYIWSVVSERKAKHVREETARELERVKQEERRQELRKLASSGIREIDNWSRQEKGIKFEQFMALHFSKKRWSVEMTKTTGDFGADLVLTGHDGYRIAVQCKCYDPN